MAGLALAAGLGVSVHAAEICRGIEAALADPGAVLVPIEAGDCAKTLQLGGAVSLICHWSFPFRSEQAEFLFRGLSAQVPECSGFVSALADDQQVNHPDSYDLRRYRFAGGEVAVSLKDKAALAQTFVFVRIEPASRD